MTIQEILETHDYRIADEPPVKTIVCNCGDRYGLFTSHQRHVAEVIEAHMQEREAAVIVGLAELMEECETAHNIAECAAYTEGEVGRQTVIENWERITDEPAEWLREQAKLHNERGFDYLQQVAYRSWYEGKESDPDEENPYADEEPNGR